MKKCIYILMTGFLVVGLGPGLDRTSQASQPVMHVSERVKIKRPEKPVVVKAEETPAAEKTTPVAEIQTARIDPAPADPVEAPPETVAPLVQQPPIEQSSAAAEPGDQSPPDAAEEKPPLDLVNEKEALFGDVEKYYVKKGRVDPFEPFLHKPDSDKIDIRTQEVQRRKPRTPLERIAIGQLKLTAIMRLTDDQMAMVEDNNGKGFIVKKGTYIGENGGKVFDIAENKVIVEEKYNDVFGKISLRQIELKLQK